MLFLFLDTSGVGVDDMFVITHAIDRLPREVLEKASPAEQVAQALRHAGVSITVTSITDIIAFAVGASTVSRSTLSVRKNSSINGMPYTQLNVNVGLESKDYLL